MPAADAAGQVVPSPPPMRASARPPSLVAVLLKQSAKTQHIILSAAREGNQGIGLKWTPRFQQGCQARPPEAVGLYSLRLPEGISSPSKGN